MLISIHICSRNYYLTKSYQRRFKSISQNNLIRQILGLPKTCHMSRLFKCLNIYNLEELYISPKLSFLESIKNNSVSMDIFSYLCNNKNKSNSYSKSFVQDIKLLESNFNKEISVIFANLIVYKNYLKRDPQFKIES